jgi:2,3-bisphosphoglycerate-independent phosphoglycerate mutase
MTQPILFLVADGMGDWPVDALGGKTPLMAARTPAMDALARRGVLGQCRTVPQGMPPGSDIANMALAGFDPARHHTGRGPIEAAAQGLELDPDDLVWRMNLVTVTGLSDGALMRDYSSGHIESAVSRPLIERLQAELGDDVFTFHPGIQYRHLLVQKGGATAPEAKLAINPPHDITDRPIAADLAAFAGSPRLDALLRGAAGVLARAGDGQRANSIWPWGQGRPLLLPPFAETYGLRGAVISAVDLVMGLGRAARMDVLEVPGVTGLIDTNYAGKVAAAVRFLEAGGEFVYLHVEAPDECGHAGDPELKKRSVELFDERIVAPLVERFPDAAFCVTCDHLTPIALRTHASDPVPFLYAGPGAPAAGDPTPAERFDEATAHTGLFVAAGQDLLPWVLRRARNGSGR